MAEEVGIAGGIEEMDKGRTLGRAPPVDLEARDGELERML
jgi:hypothetical protein